MSSDIRSLSYEEWQAYTDAFQKEHPVQYAIAIGYPMMAILAAVFVAAIVRAPEWVVLSLGLLLAAFFAAYWTLRRRLYWRN